MNKIIRSVLFLICSLYPLSSLSNVTSIIKDGQLLRMEQGEYTHCIFLPDGEREEMYLTPGEHIDCNKYVGQRVHIEIHPQKIIVPGQYGTLDTLMIYTLSLANNKK